MGSIQIGSMSWERSGKPGRFSFFPKGALTHHPEGAVVFPAEIVRSPRGIAASADAAGQGCIFCQTASLVHAVGKGVPFCKPPIYRVVYCHPISPPACVNLPPAA